MGVQFRSDILVVECAKWSEVMMDYFFYFLAFLFVLKIIWNFSVPIIAIYMEKNGSNQESISLMPIEFIFLLVIILYSYAKDGFDIFGMHTWILALTGGGLIILSFLSIIMFSIWWDRDKT